MKLYRVFLIALMTSAFAVVGCGDSGQSASDVCDACDNDAQEGQCESTYNRCINVDQGGHDECVVLALADCGI
jgi:hypothetical protein